jgi:hypothetical protein
LTLLATINIENRPPIVLRKKGYPTAQTIPLATFNDLKETLLLMQYTNGAIGTMSYFFQRQIKNITSPAIASLQ